MSGLEIFSYEINGLSTTKPEGFIMQNTNISRTQYYGFTITADGTTADGMHFHNTIMSVINLLMTIVSQYSDYPVRWRFQAERGNRTHRLHFQGFIDFGCVVKMRTALHWMPTGCNLSPVNMSAGDVERAAAYAVKADTRCDDDDDELDMAAGPYSFGFGDEYDIQGGSQMDDVQNAISDAITLAADAGVDLECLQSAVMSTIKALTDAALRARVCAYTRAGACERDDSKLVGEDIGERDGDDRAAISSDDTACFGSEYDDLFDDDTAADAADANMLASSDASSDDELARIDAADVSSMSDSEREAFFAPLFDGIDDDADDASMFAGDDTAASADAFDVDSLDAEIADSFADDAAGACVHIASKAADDAAPVHTAAPAAAVVNNAGGVNGDDMSDADFAAMCEAFARPQIDESQAYLETMMLGRKRCR